MFTFELVTLSGVKFGEEVFQVTIPTPDGYIGIFPDHMPLVSLASPGVISIRRNQNQSDDQMEHFAINGGVVEIDEHRIRVLVDEADHSTELTEAEVEAALARAEQLAKESKDRVSLDKANQQIQVARARVQVAAMKRRKKS